jgi:pimeloyl-ACP methyl ester carboxylesterase
MSIPTLPGVSAQIITSARLTTRVLFSGPPDGVPVLLLHGNNSCATWWEEVMISLPPGWRGIAPDQRGFGDADPTKKVDARRGAGDWADDAAALLDRLQIAKAHVVGSSLGGSVVWRLLMDHAQRVLSAIQVDPGSPYGFGGTRDVQGTPTWPDFAGSGGGLVNPQYAQRVLDGDSGLDSPASPRAILRKSIVKPPFVPAREDELVLAMLATHIGPQDQPGDKVVSPNWPYSAPGAWGAANALSPKYTGAMSRLYAIAPKPDILWIRGAGDLVVGDKALADPGVLGSLGMIPGWPGPQAYPPQPMVSQTRAVLEAYAAAGGVYQEAVIENAGHAPYLDNLPEFNRLLHAHLCR